MFEWLVRGVRNFRISLDYPRYEQEFRIRHLEVAEEKYATSTFSQKVSSLECKIQSNAYDQFGKKIELITRKIRPYIIAVENNTQTLHVLQRDYKEEINRLYDVISERSEEISAKIEGIKKRKGELRSAFQDKDDAYKRLHEAKDDIDWWHTKSQRTTWLGGNKGKQIPNHSLFSQSFGDLDSYKADRDEACQDIDNTKSEISQIKREIGKKQKNVNTQKSQRQKIYDEIAAVKASRAEKFRLKKEGITKDSLRKKIKGDIQQRDYHQAELEDIRKAKDEYILQAKKDAGFFEMRAKIERVLKEKELFIAEFDSDATIIARKEAHRETWLKRRDFSQNYRLPPQI